MSHYLSIILFTPLVGAFLLLFVGKDQDDTIRWIANGVSLIGFLLSAPLWFWYDPKNPAFQFVERAPWIPSIGAEYYLGIDGFSTLLILLTTMVGFIAVLSSWNAITERVKEYYIFLLVLQTGMLGAFMTLDFLLFFLFWEVMLVPMYFLIGVWGGPRKLYAAIKFFLYTLAGSVVMGLVLLGKGFNTMKGGYEKALANLRRHNIRLYITFVFGYDEDRESSFKQTVDFALHHNFYIAAFNHLTPFPGTPLYKHLQEDGRLLYENWWLDERYSYNMIPFKPVHMTPERLQRGCVESRAEFYSWKNIYKRSFDSVNRANSAMWWHFYGINAMFRREVRQRDYYPLGDESFRGSLLKVRERGEPLPVMDPRGMHVVPAF